MPDEQTDALLRVLGYVMRARSENGPEWMITLSELINDALEKRGDDDRVRYDAVAGRLVVWRHRHQNQSR